MRNREVSLLLDRMADLLEFKGELPFKVNAYRKASRVINEHPQDIEVIWQENRLAEIPGVGKGLQGKIDEFFKSGTIGEMERLLREAPKDIFELLSIQNFGPKTAALACKNLGVETIADLKKVIDDGRLVKLPGMGLKKVENIRKSLELKETAESRLSIGVAIPIVEGVMAYLKTECGEIVKRIAPAGSVRRYRETVHDIDIIAETENPARVVEIFSKMPRVTRVLGAGDTKGAVIVDDRFQVEIRAVTGGQFGAALQYSTGSQAHNIKLRGIAKKLGYKINEYGIFKDDQAVGGSDEGDIYRTLKMAWIPPEMREDRGEIEAAQNGHLPELVDMKAIKADLHIHSKYSDGQLTLEDMAQTVRSRGYGYTAFCDHSKSAIYANGLDEARLTQQAEEIDKLNRQFDDFVVLKGIEVDIMPDGSLDFSDEILARLDFVIASIHSAFKTDPTARTLAAIENRYVDVIGHPTGRLISRREGFVIDIEKVIDAAAATGTALEVNAYWDRLDLSDLHVKKAIAKGVKLSINTDAHHAEHLEMMRLGVGTARRGWATAADIINTMSVDELKKWQKRFKP
jgi:DNA polymerase (family 10)